VHVRRTDLFTALPVEKHTRDAEFERFVDERMLASDKCNIFVAADNAESQTKLSERCGSRGRVHKTIRPSGALRQTALRDAVVDLFVCAAATDGFMGSHGSSFSDAIRSLRVMQGRASMAEHRPPPPPPPPLHAATPPPPPPKAVMEAVIKAHETVKGKSTARLVVAPPAVHAPGAGNGARVDVDALD
jgi:hypothetical protein